MRESQKLFKQNDETIVLEEDENKIESFSDLFCDSHGINSFFKKTVENVELNESIQEIQEKIKSKEQRSESLYAFGTPISSFLLCSGFSMALVVLANHLLYYINFSENIEHLALLTSAIILPLCFSFFLRKNMKIKKALKNEISTLYRKMLETQLQGTIVGDPVLNFQWNPVKIQQNNRIAEYMAKIAIDENGNTSIQARELKS